MRLGDLGLNLDAVTENMSVVDRAQTLLNVGREHVRERRPWTPLLPRHEYKAMMANPQAREILKQCLKISPAVPYIKKTVFTPVVRARYPDVLDKEDPNYWRNVMRLKYIRDALVQSTKDVVVMYSREYHKSDLLKVTELIRPWYRDQQDMMESSKYRR